MVSGQHANPRGSSRLSGFLSFLAMLAGFLVLFFVLQTFVIKPYTIPSASMGETIMMGDRIYSEKVTYLFNDPQSGDVVTFDDPRIAGRVLIKRIVATGGQTVNLVDGNVVVDGVTLSEPYTNGTPSYPLTSPYGSNTTYPYTVPEGEVWVMGDNRTNSQDSRYFGSIKESSVTGRAILVYWPLNHFALVD